MSDALSYIMVLDALHVEPAAGRAAIMVTSVVSKVVRFLLTLPPLSLSTSQAAKFSGHSARHLLPTLARLFALSKEDRDEPMVGLCRRQCGPCVHA